MKPKTISLHPVKSSQISAIGHDPETNTLAVQFAKSGTVYHYKNFTAKDFAAFRAAESLGKHFGQHIKPHVQKHPFTKVPHHG